MRHTHLSDRAPTYHSATAPEHVHLVCRGCHTITEADHEVIDAFTESLRERYGFTTDVGHLTIFGTCAACDGE